jgi:DNA-binding MarR family transcriptional regulator
VSSNGSERSGAPRWLDPDERRIWLGWVFTSRLLWEEVERDLQRESGFSFGHYEILVMLSEAPDHARRMSELADATQSSRSRLSHAVARLEELGWVRRETCSTDRRGQLAVLTDEGFAALRDAAPGHVESVRHHFFDQLSPEQLDALADIQTTMLDYLLPLANARGDVRTKVLEEARAQLER